MTQHSSLCTPYNASLSGAGSLCYCTDFAVLIFVVADVADDFINCWNYLLAPCVTSMLLLLFFFFFFFFNGIMCRLGVLLRCLGWNHVSIWCTCYYKLSLSVNLLFQVVLVLLPAENQGGPAHYEV